MISGRYDILNLRNIVQGSSQKLKKLKARRFTDRISNELLYIANHKALDCLLGNKCFCFL